MIQNQRQYCKARRQLSSWTALRRRVSKMAADFSMDDRDLTAFIDTHINCMSNSLSDYQMLQRSDFEDTHILQQIAKFPTTLVRARIALGWTQTELAKRSGLRVQHVHRYEKKSYSSIKLSKAIEIALLLQTALTDRIVLHKDTV